MSAEVTLNQPDHVETESRPKGAYRTTWGNTWFSSVQHQGKRLYLGTFPTAEDAAAAYRSAKQLAQGGTT